jgi:DNA-binding MarR family transcriptional regulator
MLIYKLAHAMALEMDRRLKSHDVTMSQWALLKQLWCQEGRSQVELQDLMGLDGATITGLVQRMSNQGLIQRRSDPNDKRVQRVYLSERGRELERITTASEDEVNAHALDGFSADERTFFTRLLIRALQNCEHL